MASFSNEVKNELARATGDPCCSLAEMVALFRMGGSLVIGGNRTLGLNFISENAAIARKALTYLKQNFRLQAAVVVTRGRRLKKNNTYAIKIPPSPQVKELMTTLGILQSDTLNAGRDGGLLRKSCCRRAYLRGAFLGGGSVSRPEGDYHLELVTGNREFADSLVRVMKTFRLSARRTDRKDADIIYLKGGDAITEFLQIVGAHQALLTFENVRVVKDMRNQVNRLVNCETANLQKTADAAARQAEAIHFLQEEIGLGKLPLHLREVAETRLRYPEATLQEMVEIIGGTVTKSGVNHRMRKLVQIAKELEHGGIKE